MYRLDLFLVNRRSNRWDTCRPVYPRAATIYRPGKPFPPLHPPVKLWVKILIDTRDEFEVDSFSVVFSTWTVMDRYDTPESNRNSRSSAGGWFHPKNKIPARAAWRWQIELCVECWTQTRPSTQLLNLQPTQTHKSQIELNPNSYLKWYWTRSQPNPQYCNRCPTQPTRL